MDSASDSPQKSTRKATSKFKPALGGPTKGSETSTVNAIRKKPAVAAPSMLPVFATPAFHTMPSSSTAPPMSAPSISREVLDLSDTSPTRPLPAKRTPPDLPDNALATSKRFKPSPQVEVIIRKSPKAKGKGASRHWSPDRGETSSEVDSLNLGLGRAKLPADPFKFARNIISSSPAMSSRIPPLRPRQPSPPKPNLGDFPDLNSKPLDALKSMLAHNMDYRSLVGQMLSEHIQHSVDHDIITLSLVLDQINARIGTIKQRIAALDDVEEIQELPRRIPESIPMLPSTSTSSSSTRRAPEPFPMLPSTSTSSSSATRQVDPRRTPPSSMAISDSSNTTLDTNGTTNIPSKRTKDTAMAVDSPEIIELDDNDHDASGATLVVQDSDDLYYKDVDPITPDDLPFFETSKTEIAPASTASTSTSTLVPPLAPAVSSVSTAVGPSSAFSRVDHTASPHYKEVITILKNTFKLSTFRTNQLECIVATLDGKDVFYLAPTGGGKSLCFQLPALCVTGKTQGTTFVISPLISLISDQVSALRNKGIQAYRLTSAAEETEIREVMHRMRSSVGEKPKLVYTTPERLQKSDCLREVVNQLYEEKQLARFVIDEAHVIGSWGRDFRSSYAELNILRRNWPEVPIMALTGSANKDAIQDIKLNLEMRNPVCLAQSFNRPNLHYSVRKKPGVKKDLIQEIAGFIKSQHPEDTGIIYCLSRIESEEMAQRLKEEYGLAARHYHAGINNEQRKINQEDWMSGKCKIIVATIAFGMGIDKPDVRFVIHAALSKDMDGYYQETGRAGRDGKPSDCVLFYGYPDAVKLENMFRNPNTNDPSRGAPDEAEIERQVAKLQSVVAYCANESDCRRVLILRHFDENFHPEDCHNQCDNCYKPGTVVQRDFTTEAQQVIQLLKEMVALSNRHVTLNQLKDTWKGRNNKPVQAFKGLSFYAAGKPLSHPIVERIFTSLSAENVISRFSVTSSSGYSNHYIRPGSAAADYLDGGKRFVLSWKETEEESKASNKRAAAKPAPRKKGKDPEPKPAPQYRSLYDEDDIQDADDGSEFEAFKDFFDATDQEPSASTSQAGSSRTAAAGPSRTDGPAAAQSGSNDAAAIDNAELILERLKEKRRMIRERYSLPSDEMILQQDTLEYMALTRPQDEDALRLIIIDYEGEDQVMDKLNKYGRDFLDVLNPSRRISFNAVKLRETYSYNG